MIKSIISNTIHVVNYYLFLVSNILHYISIAINQTKSKLLHTKSIPWLLPAAVGEETHQQVQNKNGEKI